MLNGKFYTGLTEHQLNRSAGPNRQKTNFFWPDEKETSGKNTSHRSGQSKPRETIKKYNEIEEVSPPKELFKKQLSSKIQFNDITDSAKTPPSLRKQYAKRNLNRNLYEKNNNFHINDAPSPKPKTFESKIQFYDFADEDKPIAPKVKMNSTKNVQEKKRISFDDGDDWDMTKKGILKNHDAGVRIEHNIPIDITEHRSFNRNNGSNLQLSKSVDNIAKMKTEIKDDSDRNVKVNGVTSQLNKLNMNNKERVNVSRRIEPRIDDAFEYKQKGYNENSKYNNEPIKRNDRQSKSYSQRTPNHGWNNDNFETIEETRISKNFEDNRYDRKNSDQYDRLNLRKQFHTTNNTFNDRLPTNSINETDEFPEEIIKKIPSIPENRRYQNERSVTINRSPTINGSNDYPNEARRRAHSHLQSNIFFQDEDRLQQQRPLSIRESAVTRVGVGLPNL